VCVCVSKREELVANVWWSCLHNPRSRISRCYAEFGRQRVCGVVMSSRLHVHVRMVRVEFGDVGEFTRHCHSGVADKGIVLG
jgi:hypothetical protein